MTVQGYDAKAFAWRGINPDGTPSQEMLKRMTKTVVEAVEPERIVLFGSAARGEMRAKSDLDILVIKDGGNHRAVARKVYRELPLEVREVDVVVASSEGVRNCWGVIEKALQEGRTLYERTAQA